MLEPNETYARDHGAQTKNSLRILLFCVVGLLIIAGIAATIGFLGNLRKQRPPEIITTAQLYKVINISDLSSYECVYNDICTVYSTAEGKEDKVAYYCSYEAKVRAGIDFGQVEVEIADIDDSHKTIRITLPKVEVEKPEVAIESLDYMFVDKKANNSGESANAYKACIADVADKSQHEETIYRLAQENAENIIQALIKPFVEDLSAGEVTYTFEIISKTEVE